MNRRGFLGSILALGAAPAIVRADSLMRVVPVTTTVSMPLFEPCVVEFESSDIYAMLEEDFATQVARRMAMFNELYKRNIMHREHRADTIYYRGEAFRLG